jgi:hypothetical protein
VASVFCTNQYRKMYYNQVAWGVWHMRICTHSFELQLIVFKLPDPQRIQKLDQITDPLYFTF